MKTTIPSPTAPQWIILDAHDQSIGRVAATAASILRGKHRPHFAPHRPCDDHVVVLNAQALNIHPAKRSQKTYRRHTEYFGHVKTTQLDKLFKTNPEKVIEKAVWGMLPKNRLRAGSFRRLHVFGGADHPFKAQKPAYLTVTVSRGIVPSSPSSL